MNYRYSLPLADWSQLPPFVKIGWADYRIEVWDTENMWAASNADKVIQLRRDLTMRTAGEGLLHGIINAAYYIAGIQETDRQERTVTALSGMMAAVWRDNPGLIQWLDRHLYGERACEEARDTTQAYGT